MHCALFSQVDEQTLTSLKRFDVLPLFSSLFLYACEEEPPRQARSSSPLFNRRRASTPPPKLRRILKSSSPPQSPEAQPIVQSSSWSRSSTRHASLSEKDSPTYLPPIRRSTSTTKQQEHETVCAYILVQASLTLSRYDLLAFPFSDRI